MLLESFKFEPVDHCGCNSASKIFRIYSAQTQQNVNLVMKTSQHIQDPSYQSPLYSPSSSHQEEQLQHQQIQESKGARSGNALMLKNSQSSRARGGKKLVAAQKKAQLKMANAMIDQADGSHCNFHCQMIHKEWQLLENILPHPNIVQVYKVFENVDCFYSQDNTTNGQTKGSDRNASSINSQTEDLQQQNMLPNDQPQLSDSCCALLMEEAEMDLFDYVEKHYNNNKRRQITTLIDMYRQIAQGLDHIHSFNYSHNDIKSENVLIFSNLREAKITDFGLANDLADYSGLTRAQIIQKQVQQWEYRCLNHAAPEILHTLKTKQSDFDEQKADVFAFGVSLFESLFGFRPFVQYALPSDPIYKHFANKQSFSRFWKSNAQIQTVLREINNGEIDVQKLFDVIYNTLNKNPKQRISSADLLIDPLFD